MRTRAWEIKCLQIMKALPSIKNWKLTKWRQKSFMQRTLSDYLLFISRKKNHVIHGAVEGKLITHSDIYKLKNFSQNVNFSLGRRIKTFWQVSILSKVSREMKYCSHTLDGILVTNFSSIIYFVYSFTHVKYTLCTLFHEVFQSN